MSFRIVNNYRFSFLLLVVVLLLSFAVVQGTAAAQEPDSSWCVSVWFPSSDDPDGINSITNNGDVINMVNPFWYTPLPDGTLAAQPEAEDADKLAAWREAGLLVIPSIFSGMWGMLESEETRAFHIEQIVDLVVRMDYDGIDIDYEGFALSTRDNFSAFVETLSVELHARDRLLAIAVHAKTDDAGTWEGAAAQDWSRIAPVVDIFAIMTYDYTSRNQPPGPIAPSEWMMDVLAYAETVTDLSKVRMGLAIYAYSWQRGRAPATTVTWAAAQRLIESFELEVLHVDGEGQIDLDVPRLPRQQIIFADAETITQRLTLAYEQFPSLGGVAIWGLGGEDPAIWDALREHSFAECGISESPR